jgi:hypothetical protein
LRISQHLLSRAETFKGNNDVFLTNAKKSADADDGAGDGAAAVDHKVADLVFGKR